MIKRGLMALAMVAALMAATAHAYTVAISASPGSRTLYLQVGTGSFNGLLSTGGTPLNNTTVSVVSVTVPGGQIGTGVAQAMTSNSAPGSSFYDGASRCSSGQVHVSGYYRRPGGAPDTAQFSVDAPLNLVNEYGNTVAFSTISWTSTDSGGGAQPFPSGTFTGGVQSLGSLASNTWNESCFAFSYANLNVLEPGTYKGRVTYTLSVP